MNDAVQLLTQHIRDIPDFPKPGIQFKDISPLLLNPEAYKASITAMCEMIGQEDAVKVASPEARGFLFGTALALELGMGFVPIRKPGKLPYETLSVTYDLEYGQDTVAMHTDAIEAGDTVLLVDDVLATGGTMKACAELIESQGAVVTCCVFLLELGFLDGRSKLKDHRVRSLIRE